jgi:hypothetical protein
MLVGVTGSGAWIYLHCLLPGAAVIAFLKGGYTLGSSMSVELAVIAVQSLFLLLDGVVVDVWRRK